MSKKKYHTIKINGKEYKTYIDTNGVQRFVGNRIIKRIFSMYDHSPISFVPNELNLNNIWIDYHNGLFTKDEMREIYRLFEMSVCGYLDVNEFCKDKIENPVWDADE